MNEDHRTTFNKRISYRQNIQVGVAQPGKAIDC